MNLEDLRAEILQADKDIADAFSRRMEAVKNIADYKKEHGLPIVDEDQEQRVMENGQGLIEDDDLRGYFMPLLREAIETSKLWQRRLMDGQRVAYCAGMSPEDYKIARQAFPDSTLVDYPNYKDTYAAVENGECDIAIVPFDKSYAGENGPVMDMLFDGSLYINQVINRTTSSDTIRYAVLSRVANRPEGTLDNCHVMMMFTVRDDPGSLSKAIHAISKYGYNMSIMRSRHVKNLPWNYYFIVEAEGDDTTEDGQKMIQELEAATTTLKVLGRYSVE